VHNIKKNPETSKFSEQKKNAPTQKNMGKCIKKIMERKTNLRKAQHREFMLV
jgi:hypothetical protein